MLQLEVSRADMERIRMLHREMPAKYPFDKLSFVFGVSREAVARIVKSKCEYTSTHCPVHK